MHSVRLFFLLLTMVTGPALAAKTVGLLVFDNVLTSDVTAPAEVFGIASRQAWFQSYDVAFIGVEDKDSITTEEGLTLQVDYSLKNAPDLDVLIVPSAYNMKALLTNPELIGFLKQQGAQVQWLACNCSGAFLLAEAGLLDGLQATTWAGGEKGLQKDYPAVKVLENRNVVRDGRVVTSNGSLVSYQAALVLLASMSSQAKAREVFDALQMERMTSWGAIESYLQEEK